MKVNRQGYAKIMAIKTMDRKFTAIIEKKAGGTSARSRKFPASIPKAAPSANSGAI